MTRALLLALVIGCAPTEEPRYVPEDIFEMPVYRSECQYNHPQPYLDGADDVRAFCEVASMAFHNRAHQLGCCLPFTCSYRQGSTDEDIRAAFEGAEACGSLMTAQHEVGL